MSNFRVERLEQLILQKISALILRDEIKDPRVGSMVLVRAVKLSGDLKHATVRMSGYVSADALEGAVEGLNHGAGFIQSRLGRQLHLRSTPRLHFVADHSIEEGFNVTETIRKLDA
ncbi:MAG: 30S ribosome-binding factor RbfA [Spirochaetaceae bacterium]